MEGIFRTICDQTRDDKDELGKGKKIRNSYSSRGMPDGRKSGKEKGGTGEKTKKGGDELLGKNPNIIRLARQPKENVEK